MNYFKYNSLVDILCDAHHYSYSIGVKTSKMEVLLDDYALNYKGIKVRDLFIPYNEIVGITTLIEEWDVTDEGSYYCYYCPINEYIPTLFGFKLK